MGKHFTIEDRISIQQLLKEGKSYSDIAICLGRSVSTIMREVKNHRVFINRKDVTTMQTKNACLKRFDCKISGKCKKPTCTAIHKRNCKICGGCNDYCSEFEEEICKNMIRHRTFATVVKRSQDVHFLNMYTMLQKRKMPTKINFQNLGKAFLLLVKS